MISSQIAYPSSSAPDVEDIEQTRTVYIDPQPGWDAGQNVVFVVPTRGREYLSSAVSLEARFSVQLADGGDLTPATNAAFLSLPIASFFQSVRLSIGNTVIEGLNSNWQYRTLMSSILTLPYTAKNFYGIDLYKNIPDAPYRSQSRIDADNPGWQKRRTLTANSQRVSMLVPIPFNFSSAGLALPPGGYYPPSHDPSHGQALCPGVNVEMTMVQAADSTRIITAAQNRLQLVFHRLRLRLTYLMLSPSREARIWGNSALRYPYYSVELNSVNTIPNGVQNITIQVARGQIPQLFMFSFIETTYTQPDYTVNYQNFSASNANYSVESIQAECNGRVFPNNPIVMNWETMEGTYQVYELFLEASKLLGGDASTSYAEWAGGRCLIPIIIGDYMPSLRYSSPKLEGLLNINIRFANQLAFPVNFYALGIATTQVNISKDGSVNLSP